MEPLPFGSGSLCKTFFWKHLHPSTSNWKSGPEPSARFFSDVLHALC